MENAQLTVQSRISQGGNALPNFERERHTVKSWSHVTTSPAGRVIGLSIENNGVEGPLPEEIAGLHELQTLEIYEAALNGPIPSALGLSTHLLSLPFLKQISQRTAQAL